MNPVGRNCRNCAGSRIKLQSKRRLGTLDSVPQNTRSILNVGVDAPAGSVLVINRGLVPPPDNKC